jgi:hypothetical protein
MELDTPEHPHFPTLELKKRKKEKNSTNSNILLLNVCCIVVLSMCYKLYRSPYVPHSLLSVIKYLMAPIKRPISLFLALTISTPNSATHNERRGLTLISISVLFTPRKHLSGLRLRDGSQLCRNQDCGTEMWGEGEGGVPAGSVGGTCQIRDLVRSGVPRSKTQGKSLVSAAK